MSKIFGVDTETIEKLADIVDSKGLGEITLADGEKMITIKSKKAASQVVMPAAAAPVSAPAQAPAQENAPEKKAEEVSGNIVKSPIVGTFYASPSPDKPPFVKVGDSVKKGDVIMIIESMKLMNEVQSEFDGVVDKILVSNGEAVEYDQPVMIIK